MFERRDSPRVSPEKPLTAKLKTSVPVKVVDISTRGVQLELPNALLVKDTCELRLKVDDGDVTLRGKVRRCQVWGWRLDVEQPKVLLYRAGLQWDESSRLTMSRLVESAPDFFSGAKSKPPESRCQATSPTTSLPPGRKRARDTRANPRDAKGARAPGRLSLRGASPSTLAGDFRVTGDLLVPRLGHQVAILDPGAQVPVGFVHRRPRGCRVPARS